MIFNELIKKDVKEQIDYLNSRLNKGLSVKQLRESLGVGEKKLQKYLKSINYKYDQKIKNYIEVIKVVDGVENHKDNQLVVHSKTEANIRTLPMEFIDYDKLVNILNNYEEISKRMNQMDKYEEMFQWYKSQKDVINVSIPKLEIPPTDEEPITRSFKIYPNVNDKLKKFCSKNNNYKVQDIISYALKEFLDKYDK